MDIGKWCKKKRITQRTFAKMLGVNPTSLSNYIMKRRIPRHDIARKIIELSKNEITWKDLYGISK